MTPSLDERVIFERKARVPDGGGGGTESWAPLGTRWASVEPLRGRERDMAQQTESPRNYRIIVRRDSLTATVTAADRVMWRDRPMNIRFVADAGPRPLLQTFEVEAGVAT